MYIGHEHRDLKGAGMVLCENELKRIRNGKLRPNCYESAGGFVCYQALKGNKIYLGKFATINECNAAWDNYDIKRQIENAKQRLRGKGYKIEKNAGSKTYTVDMDTHWKTFKTPEAARKAFERVVGNQIKELEAKIIDMQ